MSLDINIFIDYWPEIGQGFLVTIMITIGALLVGLPLGLAFALARLADVRVVRWPAIACIEVIRNTPFMIQVFLIFYVLPFYGIRMPSWLVGIVSLGIFSSVYYAEIVRAGIESVPRGQMEAARATGMSYARGMRHIVFPQMLGFVLPPTANQTLSLVKESAILSTITVSEMTYTRASHPGRDVQSVRGLPDDRGVVLAAQRGDRDRHSPPRASFATIAQTCNVGFACAGTSPDHANVNRTGDRRERDVFDPTGSNRSRRKAIRPGSGAPRRRPGGEPRRGGLHHRTERMRQEHAPSLHQRAPPARRRTLPRGRPGNRRLGPRWLVVPLA